MEKPLQNSPVADARRLYRIRRMASKIQDRGQLAKQREKTAPPRMFKVLLLNDDYTPMDFVIAVLQRFFAMDTEQATRIMLKVHTEGRGVCGIYPRDIAATKVGALSKSQLTAFIDSHI